MTEHPLNLNLTAWSDADYYEFVDVTNNGDPQVWTDWTDLEMVAAESIQSTELAFTGTITTETGKLMISIDMATLETALGESTGKSFVYVLRGRPVGTYRVRLLYGHISIKKGLPEVLT